MKVAGITTAREVYVGSRERNFRLSEYLIVEDVQGDLVGEIVEAETYNRYLPLGVKNDFVDSRVLESLSALGYSIDEETIYVGKLRLLKEALYPVETGVSVRVPTFDEVKDLLIRTTPEKGMVLGVIKNTDDLTATMDGALKEILVTFEDGKIEPQRELPYLFDYRGMHQYPHIGIFGGSGSGKSFGLRVILEEMMKKRIPTVVLDPHYEMDFGTLAEHRAGEQNPYADCFTALQIGRDVGIEFSDLNRGDLKQLLGASGALSDSMQNVVDTLLKGRSSLSAFRDRLHRLSECHELGSESAIEKRMAESASPQEKKAWELRLDEYREYGKICPQMSVNGILWRLSRLENDGVFSKDIRPVEAGLSEGKLVVIQGSTRMIQVFSSYLLNYLYKKRREYKDSLYLQQTTDFFPPFFIVTDEAHNFAPKGYETPSKSVLKEVAQEGRKYGVFLTLATQRPTLLDETISAQLNTKFIFRTVRASDIQTIKEETDLTADETARLPYLQTGDVFISSSSLGRTSFIRVRAADTCTPHGENPFDELTKHLQSESEGFFTLIERFLPISETDLVHILKALETEEGKRLDAETLVRRLDRLVDKGVLETDDFFAKTWKKKVNCRQFVDN